MFSCSCPIDRNIYLLIARPCLSCVLPALPHVPHFFPVLPCSLRANPRVPCVLCPDVPRVFTLSCLLCPRTKETCEPGSLVTTYCLQHSSAADIPAAAILTIWISAMFNHIADSTGQSDRQLILVMPCLGMDIDGWIATTGASERFFHWLTTH